MTLYDDLGVPKDANPDAIRKAYRRKAQKAHPDKGGSEQGFRALQVAYDVLSDPERKARYDQTGTVDQGPTHESQALQYVASLLIRVVDSQPSMVHVALIDTMQTLIRQDIAAQEAELKKGQMLKERRQVALSRISPGPIARMLESEIARIEHVMAAVTDRIAILGEAQKIVRGHTYKADAAPLAPTMGAGFNWFVAH